MPAAELIAQEPLSFAARRFRKSAILFFLDSWLAGRLKLGNQHLDTMKSIYDLADLLKSMEKFEEAEELFREELAACDSPSMLSMSFSLHRCYDSWKMATLSAFSESLQIGVKPAKVKKCMEKITN